MQILIDSLPVAAKHLIPVIKCMQAFTKPVTNVKASMNPALRYFYFTMYNNKIRLVVTNGIVMAVLDLLDNSYRLYDDGMVRVPNPLTKESTRLDTCFVLSKISARSVSLNSVTSTQYPAGWFRIYDNMDLKTTWINNPAIPGMHTAYSGIKYLASVLGFHKIVIDVEMIRPILQLPDMSFEIRIAEEQAECSPIRITGHVATGMDVTFIIMPVFSM